MRSTPRRSGPSSSGTTRRWSWSRPASMPSEVGAAQMSLELVHKLATSDDPLVGKILDNVIFLLVPSLNPDGMSMVVDWYDALRGHPLRGRVHALALSAVRGA